MFFNNKPTKLEVGDIIGITPKASAFIKRGEVFMYFTRDYMAVYFQPPTSIRSPEGGKPVQPLSYGYFLASAIASIVGLAVEESYTMDDHQNFLYRVCVSA